MQAKRYLLIQLQQLSVQFLVHQQQHLILNHLQGLRQEQEQDLLHLLQQDFFFLSLFFFPLLSVVTAAVTAPALIIVGVLMVSSLGKIEWTKFEIAVPAFFNDDCNASDHIALQLVLPLDLSFIQLQ